MDTPSNNVVPLRRPAPAEPQQPEVLGFDDTSVRDHVERFAHFLLENAADIDFFVAAVATLPDAGNPAGMQAMHVVTPPITPANYALALKKMDMSFQSLLNEYGG